MSDDRELFFVSFPEKYRKAPHPVLADIDVDAVIGLKAESLAHATAWARHWLGRTFEEPVLTYSSFLSAGNDRFPGGCPEIHVIPSARYFRNENDSQVTLWADGTLDAESASGRTIKAPADASSLGTEDSPWKEITP
jgi:hypothetical protein